MIIITWTNVHWARTTIISTLSPPKNSLKVSTFIISILQKKKLRCREIRYFVQGDTSNSKLDKAMECSSFFSLRTPLMKTDESRMMEERILYHRIPAFGILGNHCLSTSGGPERGTQSGQLIVKLETTGLWSPPHCSFQHCISWLKGCLWKAHLPFEPPLDWELGFQHLWQLLLPNSFLRSLRAESVPVSSLQLPTDLAQTSIQLQLSEWNKWMNVLKDRGIHEWICEHLSTCYKKN